MKALKEVTSIYHLTIKFSTAERTGQVRGSQYDSREYDNKSLKHAKKEKRLPQMMEVGVPSVGSMETNINPCLQEDKPVVGPIEESVEM